MNYGQAIDQSDCRITPRYNLNTIWVVVYFYSGSSPITGDLSASTKSPISTAPTTTHQPFGMFFMPHALFVQTTNY